MMFELTVYYCPSCGYYGYYVALQNAVCPYCMLAMKALSTPCKDFMQLEYHSRDRMIAEQLSKESAHLASSSRHPAEGGEQCDEGRQTAPKLGERCELLLNNYQELSLLFNQLRMENDELLSKYQTSEATVQWMHDMIWDLARKLRAGND